MIDKIYIVHYTKLTERKENILNILEQINVPYEFISEYDQEDLEFVKEQYYNLDIKEYNRKIQIYNSTKYGAPPFRKLSDAEISCTIKHILAIKKLSEECNVGLILEDDAIPYGPEFLEKANKCLKEAPENWGSIFIGNGCGDDFISQKNKYRVTNDLFKVPHPATNCAEAYIMNKKSAEIIFNNMLPFQQISDWELACCYWTQNVDVYWYLPSLIYQGSISGKFKSSLR
jgi:GR25 family glycosyltransferase involved in LPS biosynthesis